MAPAELMVGIAQLVERRVVVANVAGSSPVTHPNGGLDMTPPAATAEQHLELVSSHAMKVDARK